jgi:hypothetical protein
MTERNSLNTIFFSPNQNQHRQKKKSSKYPKTCCYSPRPQNFNEFIGENDAKIQKKTLTLMSTDTAGADRTT